MQIKSGSLESEWSLNIYNIIVLCLIVESLNPSLPHI